MSDQRPIIVGAGNVLMGDDGFGPTAIRFLRLRGFGARADLVDAGLSFAEVLCDLDERRPLVVLDAMKGDGPPGTLYQASPADLEGAHSPGGGLSLHEISVLPALRMSALAGREFQDVTVFGAEPLRLSWGEGLSAPVAAAMDRLGAALGEYLDHREASDDAGQLAGNDPTPSGSKAT